MPKVGFVIRTKNEERWLETVLKTLYKQTFQDFCITIVDSGSTDKTLEIIKKFDSIQLISIKPEEFNYSYALNKGISETKTDYIAIISGHSLPYSSKWLESGICCLENNQNIAGVTGHYTDLPDGPFYRRIAAYIIKFFWKKTNHWKWMTNTNSLIRREIWEEYKFDETLPEMEDYDWALEMLHRGYDMVLEPKFSVYHSHYHIKNAVSFGQRKKIWKKLTEQIDQRLRPQKNYFWSREN